MKFIPNRRGLEQVANGPGMGRLVDGLAGRVLDAARADGNGDDEYRRSLGRTSAHETAGGMTSEVYAASPFWHLFEFGSIRNPPYRILSRAVTSAGLRFEEGR